MARRAGIVVINPRLNNIGFIRFPENRSKPESTDSKVLIAELPSFCR